MLGGANGVSGGQRRNGHVAELLVDELACFPERRDVDTGRQADTAERLGQRLRGGPVERDRDRVDRARDRRSSAAGALERGRERPAGGALAVEPDGQAGRGAHLLDHRPRMRRVQRAGGVLDDDA